MDKEIFVYVGGFEMPDKNAAAHRVTNIGNILRRNGKIVIYIGADRNRSVRTEILTSRQEFNGFECYAVGYPQSHSEWISYLSSAKKYIKVIESLNCVKGVIFYNFPSLAMRNLYLYCRKHGIKCYADVTEWYSGKGQGLLWGVIKSADSWYRMHVMHKKMDGMIVISQYLENYYRKCRNVVRIPVLADLDDPKWENHYDKSTDELKLVYAGWPKKKDRIDYLIEALMDVKRPYHLDVVGITREQYLTMYPQHKEWLEGNEKVTFQGRISHTEALEYVKKANYSCFFRPDDRVSKAGFPTKFVEAVCCGTPVIMNDTSDLKMFVCKGKNGICIQNNSIELIRDIIESIEYVLETDASMFDCNEYEDIVFNFLNEDDNENK